MLKVFAWIFTILCVVLLAVGALILYVMAAPIFGVIAAVLWGVEITKTNRDEK